MKVSNASTSSVHLVLSKARLAPIKGLTIPRMELMGMLIGTRLLNFVESKLHVPVRDRFLWSDSQCVLHWLTSNKKLPVFVEKRIREIKMVTKTTTFHYIPTELNPADLAT